jgi:hypothetical protein
MTESTDNINDDFMTALRARVAVQDAAQDAKIAAIMEGKPARPTKPIITPEWIIRLASASKKEKPPEVVKVKPKPKLRGKGKL